MAYAVAFWTVAAAVALLFPFPTSVVPGIHRRRIARRTALPIGALVLAGLLSCQRTSEPAVAPDLSGTWHVELSGTPPGGGQTKIEGTVLLQSDSDRPGSCASPDLPDCAALGIGTHTLKTRPLLGYDLPSPARVAVARSGTLYLSVGPCCDRGELNGEGRLKDGAAEGRWLQAFLHDDGMRGTFRLYRVEE